MKARVTVTLDARLLAHVDRAVGSSLALGSRRAVIEQAVRRWSKSQYETAIRDYYAAATDSERERDDAWAELSAAEISAVLAREAPARYVAPRKRLPQAKRR